MDRIKDYLQVIFDLHNPQIPNQAVLFIRHSERPSLPPDKTQQQVGLTNNGFNLARQWGLKLPNQYTLALTHTGLPRTRDTAKAISEGFKDNEGVTTSISSIQVEDGSYVHSDEFFQISCSEDFPEQWKNGSIPTHIIDTMQVTTQKLLRLLFSKKYSNSPDLNPRQIYVHVGHDLDLYALNWCLLKIPPTTAQTNYLQGILFIPSEGQINIRVNGNLSPIPQAYLEMIR